MKLDLSNATDEQLIRLDDIARHLDLSSKPEDSEFASECIDTVIQQVEPLLSNSETKSGEDVLGALGTHFGIRFEEVRSPADVEALQSKYLKKQKELGFGMLDDELSDPGVDALLFQLTNAAPNARDKFVAILNLQASDSRGYWNRFHEISHRIAEPPQLLLPFRRHRLETRDPVEKLIDILAAEIGFFPELFNPHVQALSKQGRLTVDTVDSAKSLFAPTASLLATANAVVKHWPEPALVLSATMRGRKHAPDQDVALRVQVQARNQAARDSKLLVWDNMRVPPTSPLQSAFQLGRRIDEIEHLGDWKSKGRSLANQRVMTSAIGLNGRAYALISIERQFG